MVAGHHHQPIAERGKDARELGQLSPAAAVGEVPADHREIHAFLEQGVDHRRRRGGVRDTESQVQVREMGDLHLHACRLWQRWRGSRVQLL